MATPLQNARVYWEQFGGVNDEGTDNLYVRYVDMDLKVGGWAAADLGDAFQVTLYGRTNVDAANIETIWQGALTRPAGAEQWNDVQIRASVTSHEVRCVVLKVELIDADVPVPDDSGESFGYADQYASADAPPWGVRIEESHIYASPVGRDTPPDLVLADILDNSGFTYSGPEGTWEADQLSFSDIPKDRQEAIDDVVGMTGWNYACWDGSEVEFSVPRAGTAWTVDAADARTVWSVTESLDETYNAVRVTYTNAKGKPRELILHADSTVLPFTRADSTVLPFTRADTLQAPDSIKSHKAASRFGNRYLDAHAQRQVMGTLSISGDDGVLDPLLVRPGDTIRMTGPAKFLSGTHEVTRVTLRPLEWAADIEFGSNSRRFDTWLARLAVGARSIRRR